MLLTPRKQQSQTNTCVTALQHVLPKVLEQRHPADRVLAIFMRRHHELGSRDRRVVRDTVFAVLRWWGCLAHFTPEAEPPSPEPDPGTRDDPVQPPIYDAAWTRLMTAAHLLEPPPLAPLVHVWGAQCGLTPECLEQWDPPADLAQRVNRVLSMLWPDREAPADAHEQLVPAWAGPELPPDCDPAGLLPWLQRRPPLWLRVQAFDVEPVRQELAANGLTTEQHARLENALRVTDGRANLYDLPCYASGTVEVQDLASQVVAHVCAPTAGQTWWDACSGAGGKALHLMDLMKGVGTVVGSDVNTTKLREMRRRARRAGFRNIERRLWDGQPVHRDHQAFDGVLLDAPCSCSGTWRRNPDARWRTTPEDIERLTQRQVRLLRVAAEGVRPGGTLVYATCSMFARENAGALERFLNRAPRFSLVPFTNPLTGEESQGTLQVWPWDGDCDAMFVARMHRE